MNLAPSCHRREGFFAGVAGTAGHCCALRLMTEPVPPAPLPVRAGAGPRRLLFSIAIFLVHVAMPETIAAADDDRSNILLIMADDLGFSDLGCYGGEIETPNLDRLAYDGRRFRNAYTYAVCKPTRLALLTGLHPHQAATTVGFQSFGSMSTAVPTVAELLRASGYQTFLSGKWHVGGGVPTERGFERFAGILGGSANYFDASLFQTDDEREKEGDFYITDAISASAVRFISEASTAKPFFLFLSYTAPHFPLHARSDDIEKYRGRYMQGWDRLRRERYERQIKMNLFDGGWQLADREELAVDLKWEQLSEAEKRSWDLHMAVYAAQVDVMDRGIGRVLDTLERTGRQANTIVLFLSDNGACSSRLFERGGDTGAPPGPAESYATYGLHWANASNTPLRLYKTFLHEGGISTPLIIRWPGVIEPGAFSDVPVHITDIPASFLEVAKVMYPVTYRDRQLVPLEGRSFLSGLRGSASSEERELFWNLWGNCAVRRGHWKLVLRSNRLTEASFKRWHYEPAPHIERWELYNMNTDRGETDNLAPQRPDIVEDLDRAYQAWAARTGAPG